MKDNFSTKYDLVYSKDCRTIITAEEYSDMDYPDGYYVAAVKEVYNNDQLTSRDAFIAEGCWVDASLENASELAIEKRGA